MKMLSFMNNFKIAKKLIHSNPNALIAKNLLKFNFSSSAAAAPALKIVKHEVEKPKLKIKSKISSDLVEMNYFPQKDIPLITIKETSFKRRKKGMSHAIKSAELKYSSYKLNENCKLIKGKFVHQALEILSGVHTKGSKIITEHLQNYMKGEEERKKIRRERGEEIPVEYYRISEAYVGRKRGMKIPNPRAKGKTDLIVRNISRLFMHIEKVDEASFLQNVAIGKADFTFANQLRQKLFSSGANLQMLRNFSFITTSKGRHYRHQQFLRLIQHLKRKYYREKGILLSNEIVEKHVKINLGRALQKMKQTHSEILQSREVSSDIDKLKLKINLSIEQNFTEGENKEVLKTPEPRRLEQFNKNFNKI